MYKSHHYRRRWYDRHPKLRRAFNMMELLPEENLQIIALKILRANLYYDAHYLEVRHPEDMAHQIYQVLTLD